MNKKNTIIIGIIIVVIMSVIVVININKNNENKEDVIDNNSNISSKENIDDYFNNKDKETDKNNENDKDSQIIKERDTSDETSINEDLNQKNNEEHNDGNNDINNINKKSESDRDSSLNSETITHDKKDDNSSHENTDSQKEGNENVVNNTQDNLKDKEFEFVEVEDSYEESNKAFPLNDLNSVFNDKLVVSKDFDFNDKKVKSERIHALEEQVSLMKDVSFKSIIINKKDSKGKETTIKAISNKSDKGNLIAIFEGAKELDGFKYDEYPDYIFNLINGDEGTVVKMQFWIDRSFNKNKVLVTTLKNAKNDVPVNNSYKLTKQNLKEFNKLIEK